MGVQGIYLPGAPSSTDRFQTPCKVIDHGDELIRWTEESAPILICKRLRYTADDQGQRPKGYGGGNPDSGHKTSSYKTERLVGPRVSVEKVFEYLQAHCLFVCLFVCILVGQ